MSEFNKEQEHSKAFALLFDSHNIENKFKQVTSLSYFIVKDKEEKRLNSMLNSSGELGEAYLTLAKSAIACVCLAKSADEAALMSLGFLKPSAANGIAICPTCLARAILTCEEHLATLKDIQEATSKYASTKL